MKLGVFYSSHDYVREVVCFDNNCDFSRAIINDSSLDIKFDLNSLGCEYVKLQEYETSIFYQFIKQVVDVKQIEHFIHVRCNSLGNMKI